MLGRRVLFGLACAEVERYLLTYLLLLLTYTNLSASGLPENRASPGTRTSGAPHGGPNGIALIEYDALAEDLTWKLSHFARGVHSGEPLGSILIGPSPKPPVRN